jgi:hypothetical protein
MEAFMGETYTLGLSLFDFVPPLAFLVGAICLVRLTALESSRPTSVMMAAGTGLVFLGGTLKAVWKLLYTVGLGDFTLLSEQQFVLLAPGFVLMLLGAIGLARGGNAPREASIAGLAAWKIPLMAVMTLSSIGAYGILSLLGFRRRQTVAAGLFIATIVLTIGMAGMASGEQSVARQWIEEGINSAGQVAMALASYLMYRRSASKAASG